jgi:TRAP-type uncharacterized transport system substrate-binding protein
LHAKQVPGVESLGSVDYEPIWVFYKGSFVKNGLLDLDKFAKARVAIGPEGSGTHVQAMNILRVSEVDRLPKLLPIKNDEAVTALKNGEVDIVLMVDGLRAKNVQALLNDPTVNLLSLIELQHIPRTSIILRSSRYLWVALILRVIFHPVTPKCFLPSLTY